MRRHPHRRPPDRVRGIPTGFAVGGLLPEGATRAVLEGVAAPTGGGAWLAIVASNHPEPAVRVEGENGEIVRPAHPADWLVEPVADADAPCSACSATQWERVTPTDDSRGSRGSDAGGWEPTPVIVCVRCGHEESEGAWYAATDDDAGRIDAVEQRDAIAVRRAEHAALLRETDLPLYALAGAPSPPTLSGWGVTGSRIDHVTVRHGELIELAMDARPRAAPAGRRPRRARRHAARFRRSAAHVDPGAHRMDRRAPVRAARARHCGRAVRGRGGRRREPGALQRDPDLRSRGPRSRTRTCCASRSPHATSSRRRSHCAASAPTSCGGVSGTP